jgi:2-hydroxychromene-2-carboxylate isomerase
LNKSCSEAFYNDNRCKSFAELRGMLINARSRAAHDAAQTDSERQAEIVAAKAADRRKQEAAAVARWQLISELQAERKSSAVRGTFGSPSHF